MTGKISREFFEENIISKIGKVRDDVVVHPRNGVDVGIIKLHDSYMAVTTDPLSINISFGLKRAAWFAVHILLSDIYTSGIPAQYMSIDLNLPETLNDDDFRILWNVIDEECKKFDIEIVTGHTARYAGTSFPMIGGITLFGTGNNYITTENARPGDLIVMAGSCGIQSAIMLINAFPEYVTEKLGRDFFARLDSRFYEMSCVNTEKLAIAFGIDKITSMHDATEGGLLNSLYEIGTASENGILIYKKQIIIDDDIIKICKLFNINPLRTISEGVLILTVKNECAGDFIKILSGNGIKSSIIGSVVEKEKGIKIINGEKECNIIPEDDQIWSAIKNGKMDGLK